jgi:hypothetical protein
VGNPTGADGIYARMMQQHPEKRTETAQVWFMSLLSRGRLADVAALAQRQLVADPARAVGWVNALIFSARHLQQPDLLEAAAKAPGVSAPIASVLGLELRVRRAPRASVPGLLLAEPLPTDFPYAVVQRAELMIEFGQAREALGLLVQAKQILSGRDVARLALAAYVAEGDTATLAREADSLLAPSRNPGLDEVTLLARHLIRFPNQELLGRVSALLASRSDPVTAQSREAWFGALCAAGSAGDRAAFEQLREKASARGMITPPGGDRLREFFFGANPAHRHIDSLLLTAGQMSVDLTYALLDRYGTADRAKTGG